MKGLIGFLVLAGAVGGLYVLNRAARTEDGKSVLNVAGELPIKVKLARAEQRPIIRTVQAPGEVEPLSEVDISAEVVAKILAMPIEEGDVVRKGDLLCRLDDADYRARLTSAEANIAKLRAVISQAEAEHQKARRDLDRQIRLAESDATSAVELADYRTREIQARAAVEVRRQELIEAEAMHESAKEDLAKTVITAPIDGVISQLFAKEGEVVITGTMNNPGTRIMVISDLAKMQARCRVDEGDASLVKPGQAARIYLQSDTQRSVPGHVLRVAAKGTKPQGRDVVTFETLVLVDSDDDSVKAGMTANVEIEVARSDNALTIPIEAIVHRKRRLLPIELVERYDEAMKNRSELPASRAAEYLRIVFCVDGVVAHPRFVETGISDERSVEILSGVGVDDHVVIGPYRSLDQLADGKKIEELEDERDKKKEAQPQDETHEAADEEETDTVATK